MIRKFGHGIVCCVLFRVEPRAKMHVPYVVSLRARYTFPYVVSLRARYTYVVSLRARYTILSYSERHM
jgi:hypothetical protein